MKKFLLFFAFCGLCFAKTTLSTTILPTKFFVEKIAGSDFEVNAMVVKGADPHTYEPKPSQMKALEKSELYFSVGIEFDEVWLKKIAKNYPNLKIVKTDANIDKIAMSEHEHKHDCNCIKKDPNDKHSGEKHDHADIKSSHEKEHSHDHAEHSHEHHDHSGLDPHIWLDPNLVKIQAKTIKDALIEKFPSKKETFEKNYANFTKELDELDKFAHAKLDGLKNRNFIVYHPSWGYFAKVYNLNQIAIEIEGKEPKPADLKELIEEAKEENVKVIFVAPQFSKTAAQTIAKATNAEVIEIDQLPENWLDEMKKTIEIFSKNL